MNNLNLSKLGNNIRLANPTLICRIKTEKKKDILLFWHTYVMYILCMLDSLDSFMIVLQIIMFYVISFINKQE